MNILVDPLFEYTQNNHLRYEFIGQSHDLVSGHEMRVHIGNTRRSPLLLIDEAAAAAREIYEKMPKPIVLCLSSGIDSQCLYQAFVRAQVPFEIATFRYHCKDLPDLNIEDTIWNFNNLRFSGHRFQDINIDLFDFYFGTEHWKIADESQCQSPQLTCHMKGMSLVEGTPVLSWNIPNIFRTKNGNPAINVPNSKYFAYHRFLQSRKMPGVPFFFLYTPELFFSSLSMKTMRKLYQRCHNEDRSLTYVRKMRAYQQGGFSPEFMQKRKLTGFEKFKDWLADYTGGVEWTYDLLYRTPLEMRYPNDKKVQLQVSLPDLQAALNITTL